MNAQDIAARFARETANHEMDVLLDSGLHRHLRFKNPESSMYWFEIITVPGSLIFRGDGESFVFARVTDMFEFFRGQRINPMYWSEKLTSDRDTVKRYDRELFERHVKEHFSEAVRHGGAPLGAGLGRAITREVLDPDRGWTAEDAIRTATEFAFWADEKDRRGHFEQVNGQRTWVPAKTPDFQFSDVWEWDLLEYDWWFLWALHAIVWGIAQYDGKGETVLGATAVEPVAAGGVRTAATTGDVL